jgi:glycosyltransferase involved in cell wall biosynthesis
MHPCLKIPDTMKVSLIIPAYNEEKAILHVVEEYLPHVHEIIIVDDGSIDSTYAIAAGIANDKVTVIRHEREMGQAAALRSGVACASGEVLIFIDADCTYPARYIPEFIKKIAQGCDLVLGSRQINNKNMPLLNRLGNVLLSSLVSRILGTTIHDSQTGYRAVRRALFENCDVEAKGLEFFTKMTVRAAKRGYRITEIPVEYRTRVGTSKLHPIKDGLKMFFGIFSIAWNDS